ncbi:MAG: type IV pili methyl-accepting chemotaxis transducer N-terminal domain-containing protein [Rhodobacteraceae bacterium]|nr:type IV pili methyl-accepting chemotaxis transducer N-terminal domain-containing protein [Paracoccaceae bacterium]
MADVISRGALAQAAATDGGGKARINLAEDLTIMSQSMAAAACIIDLEFDVGHERDVLTAARDEFIHMLHALEFGEAALGVPTAEHNSKAIRAIRAVHEAWTPFEAAINDVIADENVAEAVAIIIETNGDLLEKAEYLVSTIVAEHTNPNETMLADAIAITIAERQEMLSQKMVLEACEIEGNYSDPRVVERFKETLSLYENSLIALRDGMPMVGVNPPPNDEIKYELDLAWDEWMQAKPVLEMIHANSSAAEEEVLHVRDVAEILDRRMHTIVIQYLLSTPGSDDIYKLPMLAYLDNTLMAWVQDPIVIDAVRAANAEHKNLSQAQLEQLEIDWEAEIIAGGGPLSERIEQNQASAFLRARHDASKNIVTEIFVMDTHALNVAESEVTAEYWHAEDERFALTVGNRSGDIHISDVHLEEGGHVYQSQISVPIEDPDTGELIGVMTFGINIQSMF